MSPGPELAQILATVDRDQLSGHDRVVMLKARARLRSWIDSEFYADIQAVSDAIGELWDTNEIDEIYEAASSEIRAALTMTRRSAEVQVDRAFGLRVRLPKVWQALHDGQIDLAKARVVCDWKSAGW